MATIAHLLGQNPTANPADYPRIPRGRIGLELELEGIEGGEWPPLAGWRRETDGSLRDGMEYVFDGPSGGRQACDRIEAIGRMIQNNPVNNSFRCSTHIHMDVRDMEFRDLEKLVAAYCMYEGVLFDHCSMERRFSNFCTPFFLNSYLTRSFVRHFHNDRISEGQKFHGFGGWPKYSALNLKPITNYGSVEFRGSHAMTTAEELLALAQRMLHLKRVTTESGAASTVEFIESLRARPLVDIFPTGLNEGYVPDERLMDKGYSSAIDIATGSSRLSPGYATMGEAPMGRVAPTPNPPDLMVALRVSTLDAYNIFPVTEMRLSKLIRLVRALRQMQGVQQPSFWDFFQMPENYQDGTGRRAIDYYATRLTVHPNELGL